ncbi:MAG: hypothetical protein NT105_12805 [Verrucomicrobia bacterium]|nr:hypothetical protein [Verrucomicrobiota bacterium]
MRNVRALWVVLVLMVMVATQSVYAIGYTITDLGALEAAPNDYSHSQGMNNSAQVVGGSLAEGGGFFHSFLYSGGAMTDLGRGWAYAINDSGQVVWQDLYGGSHSFINTGGVMTDLGLAFGRSINDSGAVVGDTLVGVNSAFLYSGGVMTDLGPGSAYGINNSGQVVGWDEASNHAYLYDGGLMTDLGALGYDGSSASAINDTGQIVGSLYSNGGDTHAFLYSGVMSDLGVGQPNDINNSGQIVGLMPSGILGLDHAFLYSGGAMSDLNDLLTPGSGWTLWEAVGINDSGQITGSGMSPSGSEHAFLLTPNPGGGGGGGGGSVPDENSTLFLLSGLYVLGVVVDCWRKRQTA